MLGVVQHQLKRVFPGWQINERLDFTFAEMNGPPIERDRLVGIEGSIHVNQQMVMAAFGGVVARSDNTHVAQAKAPSCGEMMYKEACFGAGTSCAGAKRAGVSAPRGATRARDLHRPVLF
jgi:hypothetical protein